MREVSNQSAGFLLVESERIGVSYAELSRGIAGAEKLLIPGERIDWEVFAELMERFHGAGATLTMFEEIGERIVEDPFAESIKVIAGALASSSTLYKAIARWFAPAAIRSLALAYDEPAEGRVRVTVEVLAPHRTSLPFFHLTLGSYRVAPQLLGQGNSLVTMRIEKNRAIYDITPPQDLTLLARAKRGLKTVWGARRMIDELSRQQSELRASYQALVNSQQDFRKVIDNVPAGVLIHRGGQIVYANPSFSSTLGRDLAGQQILDLVAPENRENVEKILAPRDADATAPKPIEVSIPKAGGHNLILELAPSPSIEFDGALSAVLVGHDITDRKEMEGKALLADRLASLGTIAASVAHEINNPLTYVMDNVRRLTHDLGPLDDGNSGVSPPDEQYQMASEALQGIERVEQIVRDLKTFSRPDDDQLGSLDVRTIVESTTRIVANEVRMRAKLVVAVDEVPAAVGSASRLGQIVLNLLMNAAHAIPEGHPDSNEIRIGATRIGDHVAISVRDTGSGISPENMKRVFEPFFTTKPIGRGTGLGLTICDKLVRAMGGYITLTSDLGKGTTITVFLQVAAEKTKAAGKARMLAFPTAVTARKILIVDDEPLVANTLRRTLRGHDVTILNDAREALKLLKTTSFEMIVCDLMMPKMSGIDFYENLTPELQRTVIFATGGGFTAEAQDFLARVPNQKIDKPFNVKVVTRLVAEFQTSENARA